MKHTKIILSVLATISSLLFVSCNKSGDDSGKKPLPEMITLHFGEKIDLTEYVSDKSLFRSDDTWVADVDEKGIVTAMHIGETAVSVLKAGTEQRVSIKVEALYDFFSEPLTHISLEKAIETYGNYVSFSDDMTLTIEDDKLKFNLKGKKYGFEDKTNDRIELTYFYDTDNRFAKCRVSLKKPLPITDIYQYIWERYKKNDDGIYWVNREETFRIIFGINSFLDDMNGILVEYLEYETIPHINL